MDWDKLISISAIIGAVVAGVAVFGEALMRGLGQRFAARGQAEKVTRSTEQIKNEIKKLSDQLDRRRLLVEGLNEKLEDARRILVQFYHTGSAPEGKIVNGETLVVTEIARILRLHEVDLGDFYPLLYRKWDLAAHHIWPRDQPKEVFERNLAEFDKLTREVQLLLNKSSS